MARLFVDYGDRLAVQQQAHVVLRRGWGRPDPGRRCYRCCPSGCCPVRGEQLDLQGAASRAFLASTPVRLLKSPRPGPSGGSADEGETRMSTSFAFLPGEGHRCSGSPLGSTQEDSGPPERVQAAISKRLSIQGAVFIHLSLTGFTLILSEKKTIGPTVGCLMTAVLSGGMPRRGLRASRWFSASLNEKPAKWRVCH